MFTVFKDFNFAAAHTIRGHTGNCQNLHEHNYQMRVHVAAERLDGLGMVIDFADLKAVVGEIAGRFDHRVINELEPFDERNTTAELLAEYVCHEVQERLGGLDGDRLAVEQMEVWKSDSSCAVYTPPLAAGRNR